MPDMDDVIAQPRTTHLILHSTLSQSSSLLVQNTFLSSSIRTVEVVAKIVCQYRSELEALTVGHRSRTWKFARNTALVILLSAYRSNGYTANTIAAGDALERPCLGHPIAH